MKISKVLNSCAITGIALLLLVTLLPISSRTTSGVDLDPSKASWTFMVYMDGDNNLEGPGVADFNEMETIGSSYDVNVIVEFDRTPGQDTTNGNWEDTKRFKVEKDFDTATITSEPLQDIGEQNMGDPQTLIDFAKWTFENYPAQRYALVLWDHGGAYRGACWDDTNLTPDGQDDNLNMSDLKYAFREIQELNDGKKTDLIGFDACLMAEVGVMYEIKDYMNVLEVSGYAEPGDGWPYERILPKLVAKPSMDAEELGTIIAEQYVDSYSDQGGDPSDTPFSTMAAVNASKIGMFTDKVNELSVKLAKIAGDHYEDILFARDRSLSYDQVPIGPFTFTNYCITDTWDFCLKLIDTPAFKKDHMDILQTAQEVINLEKSMIIYENAYPYLADNPTGKVAHGIGVYFPNNIDTTYDVRYDPLNFVHDYGWDEFLDYWFAKNNAPDLPPTCIITAPKDYNVTLNQDDLYYPIMGISTDDNGVQYVEISVDGGPWNKFMVTQATESSWSYDLKVSELEPGEHTVSARTYDSANNPSPVYSVGFFIVKAPAKAQKNPIINFDFSYIALAVLLAAVVVAVLILLKDRIGPKKD